MTRRKPPRRTVLQRSRNNPNRRLCSSVPSTESRSGLLGRVQYGAYSKHKYNYTAYKLDPYQGQDVERTYCDAHSGFGKEDSSRIPLLLQRAVMLGLWSEQLDDDVPILLWTIDNSGWVFELRITNAQQALYHGSPLLPDDPFARHVLARARGIAFSDNGNYPLEDDPGVWQAIEAAEIFYR